MDTDKRQPKDNLARRLMRMRVPRISWRDLAATLGPAVLVSILAVALAIHFVRPAPPRFLTISAGPVGSTFHTYAERYKKILARKGVTLQILTSKGSLDNLNRLTQPGTNVDVGFVQGGVTGTGDTGNLVSLGSLFYQPLIVFYRADKPIARLSELRGKRIAIGAEGSGTRFLALALLKANGIEPNGDTNLLNLEGDEASAALRQNKAEAIFLSGDTAAGTTIRDLLHSDGVRIYDFTQGDAYIRRFRYLSKLQVPPGTFDLGENLPAQSFTMVAPTVELIAHTGLHPALSDLLIDAAREVHGRGSLLQDPNTFPAPLAHDYPISDDATRFYKSGKGVVYRYLPFWLASLVSRLFVIIVPIVVVVIPALRYVPPLYGWRVTRRIHHYYGELMALERASLGPLSEELRRELLRRLVAIERSVVGGKIPGSFAEQIYILRRHIKFVRDRLIGQHEGALPDLEEEQAMGAT